MMRHILALKPKKEIEENSSNHEIKNEAKIHLKITIMKNIVAQGRR
jgi:hypothetical protein